MAGPTVAASQYAPALIVNQGVITAYDIEQRMMLLDALGATGDLRELAVQQLTEDRVKLQAAEELEIELPEGAIDAGIEEFATNRGLTTEDVMRVLEARGIDRQTMNDFVESGLLWREVVVTRFRARAMPTEADLDAALEMRGNAPQEMMTLAEIALPFAERGEAETIALADEIHRRLVGGASFAALAREYSRSATAPEGGTLEPIPAAAAAAGLPQPGAAAQPGPGHPAGADLGRHRDHQARVDQPGPPRADCRRRRSRGARGAAPAALHRTDHQLRPGLPPGAARRRPDRRAMIRPVALTLGDPSGIGGEIALKAWAALRDRLPFFLIGDLPTSPGSPRGSGSPSARSPRRTRRPPRWRTACRCSPTRCRGPALPGRPDVANAAAVVAIIARGVELAR